MAIYITGDCHGDWMRRLNTAAFPEQKQMSRQEENYVLITGDFGIWDHSKRQKHDLDWLEAKTFTTLFADGNHENMDILDGLPVSRWHGGKVHFVRPHVIHLMRGQIYEIEEMRFFVFGGASSHDIRDGILEPKDPRIRKWERDREKQFRVDHVSWWERELPSEEEMEEGLGNLSRVGWKVDYIITHCPYTSLLGQMDGGSGLYRPDRLTDYLEGIKEKTDYRHWLFGHMHTDQAFPEQRSACLYEQIVALAKPGRVVYDIP